MAKNCFSPFPQQGCQLWEFPNFTDFMWSGSSVALIWRINHFSKWKIEGARAILSLEKNHFLKSNFSPPPGKGGKMGEKFFKNEKFHHSPSLHCQRDPPYEFQPKKNFDHCTLPWPGPYAIMDVENQYYSMHYYRDLFSEFWSDHK